jgi:DNA-binding LacI/PurR family transcriptional regulator
MNKQITCFVQNKTTENLLILLVSPFSQNTSSQFFYQILKTVKLTSSAEKINIMGSNSHHYIKYLYNLLAHELYL